MLLGKFSLLRKRLTSVSFPKCCADVCLTAPETQTQTLNDMAERDADFKILGNRIDFYWNPPPPAHHWGVFTCPEGSYSGSAEGFFGFCESVNVFPAGPPLNIPCIECKYYGQYYVQGPDGYCECYDDIAGYVLFL